MSGYVDRGDGGQPEIPGDMADLIRSFERHLRASNRSPRTIEKYSLAARQLGRHLAAEGHSTDVAEIRRRGMEGHISFLLDRYKPGTALTREQDLQQFFKGPGIRESSRDDDLTRIRIPRFPIPEIPCG